MIARVIPSLRTPRHVAYFDYALPEDIPLQPGDLVTIPFRNKKIIGLIWQLEEAAESPTRALKTIAGRYGNIRFSVQTLQLLQSLAVRSCTSPASVLHAWLGTLPKKPLEQETLTHQPALIPTRQIRLLPHHRTHPEGVIQAATDAAKNGQRVLVLTPWTASASVLSEQLDVPALTSEQASGARFKAWSGFLRGQNPIIVATRVGAWLSTEADLVILDEPENDDHKQDEAAPRYDARWIANEAFHLGTSVLAIGLTPRLNAVQTPSTSPSPDIACDFNGIDVHRADWSSIGGLQNRTVTLMEDARDTDREILIIHPIHGDRARLRCVDCGWTAVCARCGAGPTLVGGQLTCHRCGWHGDSVADCPSCSGVNLSKSRPGRETMIRDLTTHGFPTAKTFSLGTWNALPIIPQHALVIVSDLSLLPGGGEDTRRRERLIIATRRLADACTVADAQLVLQSDAELLTTARGWLTGEGARAALAREYAEREAFKLPPASRLVKLIIRGNLYAASSLTRQIQLRLSEGASVAGPYAVTGLPGTREARFIVQIVFPLATADETIQRLLDPVLTPDIQVDLDPIAFFE